MLKLTALNISDRIFSLSIPKVFQISEFLFKTDLYKMFINFSITFDVSGAVFVESILSPEWINSDKINSKFLTAVSK